MYFWEGLNIHLQKVDQLYRRKDKTVLHNYFPIRNPPFNKDNQHHRRNICCFNNWCKIENIRDFSRFIENVGWRPGLNVSQNIKQYDSLKEDQMPKGRAAFDFSNQGKCRKLTNDVGKSVSGKHLVKLFPFRLCVKIFFNFPFYFNFSYFFYFCLLIF